MASEVIDLIKGIFASIVGGVLILGMAIIFKKKWPYRWIVTAVVASIVIAFILVKLHQPWYWVAVSAAFIVVVPSLVGANRTTVKSLEEKIHSLETELSKANEVLADAGVSRVWTRKELTVEKCYDDIDGRYKWLGFSAIKEIYDESVREQIISISKSKALRLEYIILDPRNELAVGYQARVKNASAKKVREQLENTDKSVGYLQDFPYQVNVSLLKHSLFPTFRVTLVDDRKIFVAAYEPVPGREPSFEYSGGFNSDFIELRESGGKNLLFKWFTLYYERERLHAEKQALERFAVSERFRAPYLSIESLSQKASERGLTYMGKPVTHDDLRSIMREFGIEEKGPTICQVYNGSGANCRLGIVGERNASEVTEAMNKAISDGQDVEFLGVSSQSIQSILDDLRTAKKHTKARGKIHLLVLDPDSPSLARLVTEWRGVFQDVNQLNQNLQSFVKFCQTMKEHHPTIEGLPQTSAAFQIVHIANVAIYVSSYVPGKPTHSLPYIELRPTSEAICLYQWFKRLIEWERRKAVYKRVVRFVVRMRLSHPRTDNTKLWDLVKASGCDVSKEQLNDILSEFENSTA